MAFIRVSGLKLWAHIYLYTMVVNITTVCVLIPILQGENYVTKSGSGKRGLMYIYHFISTKFKPCIVM